MNPRNYDGYVLRILEKGNLTRAAAALGISQPALSSGLTSLEGALGFPIFNRKTAPVSLTDEGRIYVDYIRRLDALGEDFRRRIDDCQRRAGSTVIIGGPIAYIESLVTDAVIRLLAMNPEYRAVMKSAPLNELVEMAGRGEIHCFISTTDELPSSFELRFVKREKVRLCVPAEDPINQGLEHCRVTDTGEGERFDYGMLKGRAFLCLEDTLPLQRQMEDFARDYGIGLNPRIRVNQVSTAVHLARRNQGVCFASEDALSGIPEAAGLCVYPLPESVSGRDIYVTYDREMYMPEACQALIDILTGAAEDSAD